MENDGRTFVIDKNQPTQPGKSATATPLADRYQLLEKIGEGGMGTVYKGVQNATGRTVAIKFLSAENAAIDDSRRLRFEQEAKSASQLYHPNVVSIVDFGVDDSMGSYLVLEYIPGVGLDDILQSKHKLDPHELIDIFSQICKGLAHAHSKGIVHRDMKPSNVMVAKEETGEFAVKIVDFGIAKQDRTQAITTTGELLGSPLYMSPEQAMGQKVDARSDIYSVGCMLYECATGKPPFMGENSIQTLCLRLNRDPKPFSEVAPFACLSAELEAVVMRSLKREPADRYQTIAALQADLRALDQVHPRPSATIQGLKTLRSQTYQAAPLDSALYDRNPWRENAASMVIVMLLAGMAATFGYFTWINKGKMPWMTSAAATPPPAVAAPAPVKPVDAKPAPEAVTPKSVARKPAPVKQKQIAAKPTTQKIIPLPKSVLEDLQENRRAAVPSERPFLWVDEDGTPVGVTGIDPNSPQYAQVKKQIQAMRRTRAYTAQQSPPSGFAPAPMVQQGPQVPPMLATFVSQAENAHRHGMHADAKRNLVLAMQLVRQYGLENQDVGRAIQCKLDSCQRMEMNQQQQFRQQQFQAQQKQQWQGHKPYGR
jgi:serine/threonine protein kinase